MLGVHRRASLSLSGSTSNGLFCFYPAERKTQYRIYEKTHVDLYNHFKPEGMHIFFVKLTFLLSLIAVTRGECRAGGDSLEVVFSHFRIVLLRLLSLLRQVKVGFNPNLLHSLGLLDEELKLKYHNFSNFFSNFAEIISLCAPAGIVLKRVFSPTHYSFCDSSRVAHLPRKHSTFSSLVCERMPLEFGVSAAFLILLQSCVTPQMTKFFFGTAAESGMQLPKCQDPVHHKKKCILR